MPEEERGLLRAYPSMRPGGPFAFALCCVLMLAAGIGLVYMSHRSPIAFIRRNMVVSHASPLT